MENKCANRGILFDISCGNSACSGHHNERVGDVGAYCDANERDAVVFLRDLSPSLLSSLDDFDLAEYSILKFF